MTRLEAFWTCVTKTSTCWLWSGQTWENGYGRFSYGGKNWGAHKFSYELFSGEKVSEDRIMRHKCDVPLCVNPKHLETGTYQDNYNDMVSRNRQSTKKILSPEIVKLLREADLFPYQYHKVAKVAGCSFSAIKRAVIGISWKQVVAGDPPAAVAAGPSLLPPAK